MVPAVVLVVLAVSTACGDDPVTDPRRATSCAGLVEVGRATAEAVLDILGDSTVADLEAVDGLERLRRAHLERSATVGVEVRVDMPDGPVTGTAVGLGLDGSLLVDPGDGPVTLHAGDVVHLHPA